MRILKDRTEAAKAINFGKYPVLTIDLADTDEYGLKGCKVRVDAGRFDTGEPYYIDATLRVYRDDLKLTTSAGGVMLKSEYSYSDYIERLENANAPIIGPDQDVVVAMYDSKKKDIYHPFIIRTENRVSRHCITPIGFVDGDMSYFFKPE